MSKAKIHTVVNQKGGVGKSTTALTLGAGLALKGHAVLMVDLDAQGNLTHSAGASETDGSTALEVLTGEVTAREAIQHTPCGDVIPSSRSLAGMDAVLTETGKEYRLREALEPLCGEYNFIIIDTPPALGILTINALAACTSVIIPAQADVYSLQGIERLAETIQLVRRYCNPALNIEGILLTRYSPRSVLGREIAEMAGQLAEKLGTKLFKVTIREAIAIKESQISQQSIFAYAPKSNVTADCSAFIEELLGEGD